MLDFDNFDVIDSIIIVFLLMFFLGSTLLIINNSLVKTEKTTVLYNSTNENTILNNWKWDFSLYKEKISSYLIIFILILLAFFSTYILPRCSIWRRY